MSRLFPSVRMALVVSSALMLASCCSFPGSVKEFAKEIDALERRLDTHGTIVVKQPDVWGQARLTKHREEYEEEMYGQLTEFTETINASVSGSDQAYLADAFALSMAASSSQARFRLGRGATSSSSSAAVVATPAASTSNGDALGDPIEPKEISPEEGAFDAFKEDNFSRNKPTAPEKIEFAVSDGISLEPHLLLDQRSHYLNHLHELRRINEGDDTADSPGYSLNLIRLPVSVLPGKETNTGYGAEVTMTLRPHLTEELLPTTFRNLVINDLVDQLAFPITHFVNRPENSIYFDPSVSKELPTLFILMDKISNLDPGDPTYVDTFNQAYLSELRRISLRPALQPLFELSEWSWVKDILSSFDVLELPKTTFNGTDGKKISAEANHRDTINILIKKTLIESVPKLGNEWAGTSMVAQAKSRRSQLPYPPEQLISVLGFESFYKLVKDARSALANERFSVPSVDGTGNAKVYIHLPDVQGYLREKLIAASELLKQESNQQLWDCCGEFSGLSLAIRNQDNFQIAKQRDGILPNLKGNTSPALVWAILVESALLNDKLRQDMSESPNLNGSFVSIPPGVEFFRPYPSPESRQAFNEYVQCRWPIHIFALDPASQDQNLQSTFSTRREMQLAISLAFVNGRISAQNMMRFARRLEFDFATVDLNGTAVGFSHGNDTFGWRFYPRFQVPDVEGNMKVVFRDLFVGGPNKDALLKQRRLEPGIRECYAVVIMPSFVPYATLNVSSSWFSLTNPRRKHLDSADAMNLSQRVKTLQNESECIVDGACYRDCDLFHLTEKVRQLETRLPLQSTEVQIPHENTLGGFAMFNAGVTDMAPELFGFYGTSAINPNYGGTLFLVGNHFSVHQTKVIAGGQEVAKQEMISRQVIQVTIPPNPMLVGDANGYFVDVQIATPYGVTQHLLVPAVTPSNANAGKQHVMKEKSPTPPTAAPAENASVTPATAKIDDSAGPRL